MRWTASRQQGRLDSRRYTAPKLEGKARELVDEGGTKATNREERERMLVKAAFLEARTSGSTSVTCDSSLGGSEGCSHKRVARLVGFHL